MSFTLKPYVDPTFGPGVRLYAGTGTTLPIYSFTNQDLNDLADAINTYRLSSLLPDSPSLTPSSSSQLSYSRPIPATPCRLVTDHDYSLVGFFVFTPPARPPLSTPSTAPIASAHVPQNATYVCSKCGTCWNGCVPRKDDATTADLTRHVRVDHRPELIKI